MDSTLQHFGNFLFVLYNINIIKLFHNGILFCKRRKEGNVTSSLSRVSVSNILHKNEVRTEVLDLNFRHRWGSHRTHNFQYAPTLKPFLSYRSSHIIVTKYIQNIIKYRFHAPRRNNVTSNNIIQAMLMGIDLVNRKIIEKSVSNPSMIFLLFFKHGTTAKSIYYFYI